MHQPYCNGIDGVLWTEPIVRAQVPYYAGQQLLFSRPFFSPLSMSWGDCSLDRLVVVSADDQARRGPSLSTEAAAPGIYLREDSFQLDRWLSVERDRAFDCD